MIMTMRINPHNVEVFFFAILGQRH